MSLHLLVAPRKQWRCVGRNVGTGEEKYGRSWLQVDFTFIPGAGDRYTQMAYLIGGKMIDENVHR